MRRFATLGFGVLFALVAQPVLASTIKYVTDRELIELSDRVVHARVTAQRAQWGGPNLDRIYTVTTLDILEDLTGRPGDRVEVWELGGALGDNALYVGGQVRYRIGEEVLVCLRQGPHGLRSVAMGYSKFDVRRTAAGESLVRNGRDLLVVGAPSRIGDPTLDEFRRLVEQVTGRPSRRVPRAPADPEQERSVQAGFVLLGNFRWVEADTSTPVAWRRNLTAASPLTSGNTDTEIGVALAAWTNPPSASLVLQFAGTTTFVGDPAVPGAYTGGLVTFEDPNGDITPPTLAVGGGGCSGCTTSMVNGTLFTNFTFGFVIFDGVATLDPEFRTVPDFTRVMTHEVGHAIGLGHADLSVPELPTPEENIMNSSCCFPETPIPPAIGPDDLAGLNFIYPSNPGGPQMTLDKTSLRFGAVTSGGMFLSQTSAQIVRMTQSGAGTVTWTIASNQPWLQVSPASGSGSATLSISVVAAVGLPASGSVNASITLVLTGAGNSPGPIAVVLTLIPNGTSTVAFGVVDTPADGRTGVTGAIPFTGWALDDVEVQRVMICRAAFGAEVAPVDPNCAGAAQIFVGFAIFIDGARPDVQAGFPGLPMNTRAGWGFMVLTNMLPSQGNGTFQFFIYAQDRDGHSMVLGTRTMTCANATATLPFGAIDTPGQGGLASGTDFVNFGWALTPNPKFIPFDGSTITVLIDGVSVGTVSYNHFRSDIATLFPGLVNSNGAIGFKIINTTTLSNGLHTIVWVVSDNAGAVEGIGSRFFTVSNGVGSITASVNADSRARVMGAGERSAAIASAAVDPAPVIGRRGWDLEGPWRLYGVGRAGRAVIRGEELDRFELALGAHAGERHTGYLRVGAELAPLPVGSRLDETTGVFTWAPGVGFVGAYDLVFVRWVAEQAVARRDVRIILAPKGRGHVGTQVEIDTPRNQQSVTQPVVLTGWAADLDAPGGTGIDTLHVWALPRAGGAPVFVGTAELGGVRPDVAAVHGEQFRSAGFALTIGALSPGEYDLAVFPWSNVTGAFAPPKTVTVTVQ